MGGEPKTGCQASDKPLNDSQLSPLPPIPSVEGSKCPKDEGDILPQNSQLEGKEALDDVTSKKRAAWSHPSAQFDSEGFHLGAVPTKMIDRAAPNNLSKKGGPVKKLRAASTPTIKSFFKPATPRGL